jgi:hypothetical protein
MKKWKKWRLSKYRFPTYIVKGSKPGEGELVVGRRAAKAFLSERLSSVRVERMELADTRTEWIFMERLRGAISL